MDMLFLRLMFPQLTYDQLPPSIIVGTRGELNSQLWNVTGKPRKTNLKTDVFSPMILSCHLKISPQATDILYSSFYDVNSALLNGL